MRRRRAKSESNQEEARRFLPAFGQASLLLGLFSVGLIFIGQPMLEGSFKSMAKNSADGAESVGTSYLYANVGLWIFSAFVGVVAVLLGGLSLLGFGKVEGRSRRVSGFFGLLLGGFIAIVPLMLLPAIQAARRAAERGTVQSQLDALDQGATRLSCINGSVVLRRPAPDWVIVEGEQAAAINPSALIVAMRAIPGPKPVIGMVLANPIALEDLGIEGPQDLATRLQQIARQAAEESEWTEKTEPILKNGRMGESTYVEYGCQGIGPDNVRYEYIARLVYHDGHLVDLLGLAPSDFPGKSDDWADPFFEAVSLTSVVEP